MFLLNKFSKSQVYNLLSSLKFFEKEFFALDSRTMNILKSEITRITNCFVSDSEITKTFCPKRNEINFRGFKDVINKGKIVVLNMNINEYRNLSRIIAAYLKLDFQTEVLRRLSNSSSSDIHPVAFISDEYSEYVSATDANFFSQSRESKCINVVSTQSYTSLLNAISNKYSVEVIVQNLVNKLWFRSDDIYTIEEAQHIWVTSDTHFNHANIIKYCNRPFSSVEEMPKFPGGDEALLKYVGMHLNYPKEALRNNVQGKCILKFVVTKIGTIGKIKIVRSLSQECDEEAKRVVRTLPEFFPGRQNGRPVNVWYTLPVNFRLSKE